MSEGPPAEPGPGWVRRRAFTVGAVALLAVVLLWLEAASFATAGRPRRSNDTNGYMRVSQAPLMSRDFLLGTRPPATPLLYKALGQREAAIVRAQSLLSVVCWLGMAVAVARQLRSRAVAGLAACAICAFSLAIPVNQWDWVLLSESLSLSLMAAVVATSLWLGRSVASAEPGGSPRPGPVVLWGGCCLLFALTRDVNVYLLACALGFLALFALRSALARDPAGRAHRRAAVVSLLVLGAVVAAGHALASGSGRWKLPFLNVLLKRVVPRAEVYAEFADRYGMPRNPELEPYAGSFGWHRPGGRQEMVVRLFFKDEPALADVKEWIHERGLRSYARYLMLDHPVRALRAAGRAFAVQVADPRPNRRYGKGAGATRWSRPLSALLHPGLPQPVLAWASLLAAAGALAWFSAGARAPALAVVLLCTAAAVQAYVAFHGDASNVDRHMAASGIAVRLAGLLLLATVLDRLVAGVRALLDARARAVPEAAP